jgi:hypothetical protein
MNLNEDIAKIDRKDILKGVLDTKIQTTLPK